jgi:hypothetical protein
MASKQTTTTQKGAEKAATTSNKTEKSGDGEKAKADETKAQETALALADQNKELAEIDDDLDFEDAAGEGHEERDASMVKTPRLDLLQSSSGLVKMPKAARPKGLEDAEMGQFIDTVSKELLTDIEVLPVHYVKWYNVVELSPEVNGKRERAFRGRLKKDDQKVLRALHFGSFAEGFWLVNEKGQKVVDDKGNTFKLEECIDLYVVYQSPKGNGIRCAVCWLQSKKLSVFREWNSGVSSYMVQGRKKLYNPPLRAARTILTSVYDPDTSPDRAHMALVLRPAVVIDGVPNFAASMVKKSDPRWAVAERFYEDLMSNKAAPVDMSEAHETVVDAAPPPSSGDRRTDKGF